jgi:hypothetical protein
MRRGYGKGGGGWTGGKGDGGGKGGGRFSGKGGGGFVGGKGGGGIGKGKGKGSGGGKPFWRQFVDPSDDPEVIAWCRETIGAFVSSGETQREFEHLTNPVRNTMRSLAPSMGVGWVKTGKGCNALVRMAQVADEREPIRKIVEAIRQTCLSSGGKCGATAALKRLSPEQIAFVQSALGLRSLKLLPSHAGAAEALKTAGLRLNARANGFLLEGVEDDDSWHVRFDKRTLSAARASIDVALEELRRVQLPPALRGRGRLPRRERPDVLCHRACGRARLSRVSAYASGAAAPARVPDGFVDCQGRA